MVDILVKILQPSDSSSDEGDLRYTLSVRNLESLNIDLMTPISNMPLPQAVNGAIDNILTKAEGNTLRFTVVWTLIQEDSSVISTTGNATINTSKYSGGSVDSPDEQARFLLEDFQSKGVEWQYQIIIGDSAISRAGSVERLSLQKTGSTPVTWKATLTFIAGDVVTI